MSKSITIVLEMQDGEKPAKKTFTAVSPKARVIRTAIDITERIDNEGINTALLDEMVDLVVGIFGHKFTADNLWDGIDADKLFTELSRVIGEVSGKMTEKLDQLPNGAAAK